MWVCLCDCGMIKEKYVSTNDLKSGKVKSCGCIKREVAALRGKENTLHGMTKSRIWNIWSGMRQRCKHNKNYLHVKICSEWDDFLIFYEWATANGYRDDLTLDRIDPTGNYCPENCRWATWKTQENNRRNNKRVRYKGDTYTIAQLAEKLNIGQQTLRLRICAGWPEEELSIPPNLNNKNIRSGNHAQ